MTSLLLVLSCNNNGTLADAYGNFEVDETIISARTQGELMAFDIEEGQSLKTGQVVGYVDTTQMHLRRAELTASLRSTEAQRENISAQIEVARDDLSRLKKDQVRVSRMFDQKAATQKQLDDINSAVQIAEKNLQVLQTQYPAIAAKADAVHAKVQMLEQSLKDAVITNQVEGSVLVKLAQAHEMMMPGKGLYIIANLDEMVLKAYVSADQLGEIKLGQTVKVYTDGPEGEMKEGRGEISWISDKSEFTPKTIQTRNERANTVYAFKVRVENDGSYKVGMHGEVKFKEE